MMYTIGDSARKRSWKKRGRGGVSFCRSAFLSFFFFQFYGRKNVDTCPLGTTSSVTSTQRAFSPEKDSLNESDSHLFCLTESLAFDFGESLLLPNFSLSMSVSDNGTIGFRQ